MKRLLLGLILSVTMSPAISVVELSELEYKRGDVITVKLGLINSNGYPVCIGRTLFFNYPKVSYQLFDHKNKRPYKCRAEQNREKEYKIIIE